MKIKQLSLFLENKPGHVRSVCRTLADAGINIETMSLADTEQFGILRLIVKDSAKAVNVFDNNNIVVKTTDVVALAVKNEPGGLADILDILDGANINIEYVYDFHTDMQGKTILVFRFENPDLAIEKLQAAGVAILGSEDLFG